jgi:hypothetical protein
MSNQPITVEPEDVLSRMDPEEFARYAKLGFNYALFDSPIKQLHIGDIINLAGDYYEIGQEFNGIDIILEELYKLPVEDIQEFLLNEFARIGVMLTFISLGKNKGLQKIDNRGKPLPEARLEKELEKEIESINNTSVILREVADKFSNELGLNTSRKEILEQDTHE